MKKLLALFMSSLLMLTFLPNSTLSVSAVEIPRNVSSEESNLSSVPDSLNGTRISMLIWWNSDMDDQLKAEIFLEETGIQVTYETAAMDKYQRNLAAKVMAQNSPALAGITNEWYPQPVTRGLMQPLSKITGWDFTDESKYALSLMKQFAYQDKMYGIALKGSSMNAFTVMFFNKDILKAQGLATDPYQLWKEGNWNWDTCLQIAQACTDENKGLKGITNASQFYWMLSAGQDFVRTDPQKGPSNNIYNPKLLDAWNWNWDLINTYKVIDTTYTGATPFFQGKAAMFGGGSYMMRAEASHQNYVPQNMKDDWGVVPFPSPKGNTVAACEGTVWGFPAKVTGKKLQAGAHYLHYYLDDRNYCKENNAIYPNDHPECSEVIDWMWEQPIQSYNSVGVLCYGGEYTGWSIQYSLVDEADTKAKMKSNLYTWKSVLDANILKLETDHICQYDADCDATCNICGKISSAVAHTYDADCDTECNLCGNVRSAIPHTYDAECDPECNLCGMIRGNFTHIYDNGCDAFCNICNAEREISGHIYDNVCDTFCNICNAERWVSHYYRNVCDTNCAVCGIEINPPHKFSDNCDIDCNLCGAVREIVHSYSSACDASCNVCNTYRVVPPHVYTNNCDRDCNVCGITRTAPHTYSNDCDKSCNRCKATRTVAGHEYKKVITKATTTKDGKIKNVCAECGYTSSKVTTIYKASKISLSKTSYTYNGKVQKPSVVVKDSKGKTISSTHYTVTYASGRKNVGTYKVTVKFKGNYSGTKTLTFKINPVKTTVSGLTASTKKLTVNITKKSTQVTGYQIQYSTSKTFKTYKTKTVTSYKTTKVTLTGLSSKKTYYVRVRTYKTVNGVKYYSGWSTIKYKKTK